MNSRVYFKSQNLILVHRRGVLNFLILNRCILLPDMKTIRSIFVLKLYSMFVVFKNKSKTCNKIERYKCNRAKIYVSKYLVNVLLVLLLRLMLNL